MAAPLTKYDYEFEWVHAGHASTLSVTAYTPSHEFVQGFRSCVTVYHMGHEVPQVRMVVVPLQHMRAILIEIERENSTRATPIPKEVEGEPASDH